MPQRVEFHCQLPFAVDPLILPGEKYPCNTKQVSQCMPTYARRVKSEIIALTGETVFLRFYQKRSG